MSEHRNPSASLLEEAEFFLFSGKSDNKRTPPSPRRKDLHAELVIVSHCPTPLEELCLQWRDFFHSPYAIWHGTQLMLDSVPPHLRATLQRISVVADDENAIIKDIENADLELHCFQLNQEEPALEELEMPGDEFVPVCQNMTLPHATLDGLWESLHYESSIKKSLLNYVQSAMLFGRKGVSPHIVHWNRLILLHGPPGTGKTSLCKALCHKLAIRHSTKVQLLQIQSHSLHSKWLGGSAKLLQHLFDMIRDMLQDDPETLICVLLDEIETLAASRTNLQGDPTDSMRAVNALLTNLDSLCNYPNLLVLTTTNVPDNVDAALWDRADIKLYLGPPAARARHHILQSTLVELVKVGLVLLTETDISDLLDSLVGASEGLSGRALRRLPLQAHAMHLAREEIPIPAPVFLQGLLHALQEEHFNTEYK
jgi:DNA polymerase III delta prime subunit